jgi:hypothetical protein
VVPGLFGYVSATKWVVDMEVTSFDEISAYWTERGWDEQGPVVVASRIDVPRSGADVPAGELEVAGVAWAQRTGVERVEVAVDGGDWREARLAAVPGVDTWVQWVARVDVEPGDHVVRVRATDRNGVVQSAVERQPYPGASSGLHTRDFSAS